MTHGWNTASEVLANRRGNMIVGDGQFVVCVTDEEIVVSCEETVGVDWEALRNWKENMVMHRQLQDRQAKYTALEEAVRLLMDETDPDGEGDLSRNLRGFVMDGADQEAIIQAEGWEE